MDLGHEVICTLIGVPGDDLLKSTITESGINSGVPSFSFPATVMVDAQPKTANPRTWTARWTVQSRNGDIVYRLILIDAVSFSQATVYSQSHLLKLAEFALKFTGNPKVVDQTTVAFVFDASLRTRECTTGEGSSSKRKGDSSEEGSRKRERGETSGADDGYCSASGNTSSDFGDLDSNDSDAEDDDEDGDGDDGGGNNNEDVDEEDKDKELVITTATGEETRIKVHPDPEGQIELYLVFIKQRDEAAQGLLHWMLVWKGNDRWARAEVFENFQGELNEATVKYTTKPPNGLKEQERIIRCINVATMPFRDRKKVARFFKTRVPLRLLDRAWNCQQWCVDALSLLVTASLVRLKWELADIQAMVVPGRNPPPHPPA